MASREAWLRARKELLMKEKEWNRQRDALSAERRKLPMVRIEKDYVFEGPREMPGLSVFLRDGDRLFTHLLDLAADLPMPPAEFRAFLEGLTLQKRLPSLADVAETAVFLASDRSTAMTAAVAPPGSTLSGRPMPRYPLKRGLSRLSPTPPRDPWRRLTPLHGHRAMSYNTLAARRPRPTGRF